MKKNLFLFGLLIILISFTYFWEQLGHKTKFSSQKGQIQVFDIDPKFIIELGLKETKLIKRDNHWIIGELDYWASQSKIDFILKTLQGINVISVIDTEKIDSTQFFVHQNHPFSIKTFERELQFRLGDISSVTGYFYLEKFENGKSTLYLCRDGNFYEGIYKDELEAEFQKYLAFKNIITLMPMGLIENQLIPDLFIENIQSVRIDNKSNRWFELDFVSNQTTPNPIGAIKVKLIPTVFQKLWAKVKVLKIEPIGNHVLADLLSEVTIKQNSKLDTIKLYGHMNNTKGYFVSLNDGNLIYSIDEGSKDFFFANYQDFWIKKLNYNINFAQTKKFEFKLGDKKSMYQFQVKDIDAFKVSAIDSKIQKINDQNINLLFNVLLNLVEFEEASFVSQEFSKLDAMGFTLAVKLFGKTLRVNFSDHLITVQDLTEKVEFSYPHKFTTINIDKLSDFFTLK